MTQQASQRIGFIGLGIMGAPMAGHLLEAGHQLFVNTHGNTPEPFISRATICASPVLSLIHI